MKNNIIKFPDVEFSDVNCAVCQSTDYHGATIALRIGPSADMMNVMICNTCMLEHVKKHSDMMSIYAHQLEKELTSKK